MDIERTIILILIFIGGILLGISELVPDQNAEFVRETSKLWFGRISKLVFRISFVISVVFFYIYAFVITIMYMSGNYFSNFQYIIQFLVIIGMIAVLSEVGKYRMIETKIVAISIAYGSMRAKYISGWIGVGMVCIAAWLGTP